MRANWLFLSLAIGCGAKELPAKRVADNPGSRCIDQARIPRSPAPDAPQLMNVAHILVRHAGLDDAGSVTRTREEACLRAEEARGKLLAGSEWDTVFNEYSDAKGATQGELFDVNQSSLDPDFANAAFALKVDELSHVVESKRGFHVIWRKK